MSRPADARMPIRVHAKIAEYGSGGALNLDKERKFVAASRAYERRLSIHASDLARAPGGWQDR
jgi:hypothetical protein